jgi:hypothetical protein
MTEIAHEGLANPQGRSAMKPYLLPAVVASLFTLVSGSVQAGYAFTNIVDPVNPTFTQALGINNAGTIVGYGNASVFNGFQVVPPYGSASFARQNFPGADGGTQVVGISGTGTTVGFIVSGGVTHGFAQTGGTFTVVDEPGGSFTQLLGINKGGTTAAGYFTTDPTGLTLQTAMIAEGGPSFLGAIFVDINPLLPANFNSQATGVNDAGTVVGFYQDAMGNSTAFTDNSGAITSFSFPGAVSTQALGINDLGEIVGDYVDSGLVMHGFLDNAGVFTTLDPLGSLGTTANGINDLGQIVGFYTNPNQSTVGFLAQAQVAEPGTVALLGIGLAGIAFARRRPGSEAQPA